MGNNKKEKSNKKNEAQKNKNTIPDNTENKELVVKNKKTFKEKKAKWLRQTSLTVALILIIVAACIGINILVEEVNIADIDFTQDKVYSLSDMSKSMISGIDKEVTITIFNMNESVEDFAKKYNSENKNIKVEVVEDLSTRPDITDEYGITSDSNIIIVSSGDKEKLLSSYDLYTTDYTTYQTKDITEEALTNAIIDVTTEEKPVIYYLTGHEKYSVDYVYYFRADLENEAYEFNELDLLTAGEVPEDCSVLMISSLASDLTEAEKDAILNYIDKGGKIILFADPNTSGDEMPNFQEVLDEYGVEIDEGIMLEEDSDRMLLGTPNAILVTVSPYTSVTKETNMNMNACFMNSGRINIADSEELEELFSNCYLYCLPSDIEGMPISLLEAMSYGRNCLVSNIEENMQVCENYAISFEKSNIQDLKEKLEDCLNGKIERKDSTEISDYVLNKYNWDDVVEKTEKLYKEK